MIRNSAAQRLSTYQMIEIAPRVDRQAGDNEQKEDESALLLPIDEWLPVPWMWRR